MNEHTFKANPVNYDALNSCGECVWIVSDAAHPIYFNLNISRAIAFPHRRHGRPQTGVQRAHRVRALPYFAHQQGAGSAGRRNCRAVQSHICQQGHAGEVSIRPKTLGQRTHRGQDDARYQWPFAINLLTTA